MEDNTVNDNLLWYNFLCYIATLSAIVVLIIIGAWMAGNGKPTEALGIGAGVTGLIGVIGTFRPKSPEQSPNNKVEIQQPTGTFSVENPPAPPAPAVVLPPAAPVAEPSEAPPAPEYEGPSAEDVPPVDNTTPEDIP